MKVKTVFFVFFFAAQNPFAAELRVPGPLVGQLAGGTGTGLNGSFFAARDVGGNNESALSVALESRPSVTFQARVIDYG